MLSVVLAVGPAAGTVVSNVQLDGLRLVVYCTWYVRPATELHTIVSTLPLRVTLVKTGTGAQQRATVAPMLTVSTYQPLKPKLSSEPHSQRSCIDCPVAAAGKFTEVVMKPPALPVQAE